MKELERNGRGGDRNETCGWEWKWKYEYMNLKRWKRWRLDFSLGSRLNI